VCKQSMTELKAASNQDSAAFQEWQSKRAYEESQVSNLKGILIRSASTGVWACILMFFVHFNGFAVQETITTPLVQDWFGWDEMGANLLFTAAGVANLLCAVLMSYLAGARVAADGTPTQLVGDRALLIASCALALAGWVLLVPPNGWGVDGPPMSLLQFGVSFGLVTVAFPFGRGVCLSMVGKLLGDRPQGAWMGIMFALGAIARIAGPFWAVTGYNYFGALAVFGSTAALFAASLVTIQVLWTVLTPEPATSAPGTPSRASMDSHRFDRYGASSPSLEGVAIYTGTPGLTRFTLSPSMSEGS